jgi:hypothetical protein
MCRIGGCGVADPVVVQQALAFRAALLRQEAAQMRVMAARWRQVERNLEQSIADVLAEIERRQAAGETWSRHTGPYTRLERYQALLRQVRQEFARFTAEMEATVQAGRVAHGVLGVEHSAANTALALGQPELAGQFNRVNVAAVESMAAVLEEEAPVGALLQQAWPGSMVRMTEALATGTALGWNPRKTERAMREAGRSVLQRALLIARTEQLRAYRTASLANYRASGVLKGYKRLASKSARTCLACLVADGEFFTLDQAFEEHPAGRCTMVPVLASGEAPEWEPGRVWLERQPATTQRQVLGPAAFEAWRAGAVRLEDLVERHEHPVWGGALQVRSLKKAIGEGEAKRFVDLAMGRTGKTVAAVEPAPTVLSAVDARARVKTVAVEWDVKVAAAETEMQGAIERLSDAYRAMRPENIEIREKYNRGELTFDQAKEAQAKVREKYGIPELARQETEAIERRNLTRKQAIEAVREPLKVDNPANATIKTSKSMDADVVAKWQDAVEGFNDLVDRSVMPSDVEITVKGTRQKRSYYDPSDKAVYMHKGRGERTAVHEFGHWLEDANPDIHQKILDFYDRRTLGEALEWMGRGYNKSEKTRRDKFLDPYMGKDYGRTATEILSMGLEMFYADPVQLAENDPDYFDFIFDLVRGR